MTAPSNTDKHAANETAHKVPHYEVEQKYALSTALAGAVPAHLTALGFTTGKSVRLTDIYYTDAARTFITQHITLRLRATEGKIISLDYRASHQGAANMRVRQEIELAIENAPLATGQNFLAALGYQEYVTVSKNRTTYSSPRWPGIKVEWDVVDIIGIYLELEALVATAAEIPAAESRLRALASELGLTPDMLTGSPYRDLVATAKGLAA